MKNVAQVTNILFSKHTYELMKSRCTLWGKVPLKSAIIKNTKIFEFCAELLFGLVTSHYACIFQLLQNL